LLAVQRTPGNIDDRLKKIPPIENTRHRSTTNFTVNPIAGLIACTWQLKKPSLHLFERDLAHLPALI